MSVMREELHHLVDRLPEAKLGPALELIQGSLEESEEEVERDLPFFGSFAMGPDLSERHEEILRNECGR
ncbi:hypothetical protein ACFHYQ_04355 [Sphaerimonospora cavernae]|uniref:Uncharacterized protein n=1 Tax=Sphaerimonospora cavernae TaxID=1740611 RepID=A0ABV6TZA6_9ACTN